MEYEVAYFFGGGGCGGFVYPGVFAAIEKLGLPKENVLINTESVGALMGTAMALGISSTEVSHFVKLERKLLGDILTPTPSNLLSSFRGKPWFDNYTKLEKVIEAFYGKSLKLRDVPKLNVFTAAVGTYQRIALNHKTAPSMSLTEALTKSSLMPFMFEPYEGQLDGGFAEGSAIEYFLHQNSAEYIISTDLMQHWGNKFLTYAINQFKRSGKDQNATRKERAEYVEKNRESENIIHIDFKIPPWHFLDASLSNIENLEILGKLRFRQAYQHYLASKNKVNFPGSYEASSAWQS